MLDKKELEKEIEKNIKNIGYCDEKSLNSEGEILKDLYLKELNLGIIKNTISKDIENIYLNRIEREKKKLNIDTEKIKVLISTIGVVTENLTNILDETTVEKNLRVFEKIEKIYIFHTESTKNHFDNLKKRIENKHKNSILIEGSLVEESIIKMNKYLITLLKDITKFYNKDEIIMDITLGMKLSAISMYRLSVDNGVKVVNWKEIYLPIYKEENGKYRISGSNRVTFSTNLEIIKEALTENRQLLIDINNSFDRCEYETVASYYEKIGRKDKEVFFSELGKLLKTEVLLSFEPNIFYEKLDNFVKEFLANKEENQYTNSMKNLIIFFKILSDLKLEDEDNYNKDFIEILEKKYKKKYGELDFEDDLENESIEDSINNRFSNVLEEHYRNELKNIGYLDTNLKTFLTDFSTTILRLIRFKNGIDSIEDEDDLIDYEIIPYLNINNIHIYLAVTETLKKVKNMDILNKLFQTNSFISKAKNLDDINSYIFMSENNSEFDDENESPTKRSIKTVEELFDFTKFKEKINTIINYKEGTLQFLNLGINIDLTQKGLIPSKWDTNFLNAILSKEDYKISENYLEEYLENIIGEPVPSNTYKNVKGNFKKFVDKLNDIILDELKLKNVNETNLKKFIDISSHERNKDKPLYKIDNYYFD